MIEYCIRIQKESTGWVIHVNRNDDKVYLSFRKQIYSTFKKEDFALVVKKILLWFLKWLTIKLYANWFKQISVFFHYVYKLVYLLGFSRLMCCEKSEL